MQGFNWSLFAGGILAVFLLIICFAGKHRSDFLRVLSGSTALTLVWVGGLYSIAPEHPGLFVLMLLALCAVLTVLNWSKQMNMSPKATVVAAGQALLRRRS